ncbi:MAG: tetratricopeptide repeat protein [Desulfobacca sp.]|nr:tetratricopeptide repeat protein [Desulfobacca sp.]
MAGEDWQKLIIQGLEQEKSQDCPDLNLLGQYLEGRLKPGERHRLESHLQNCLYCQNQLLELKDLLHLVDHGPPLPAAWQKAWEQQVVGVKPTRWRRVSVAIRRWGEQISPAGSPRWWPAVTVVMVILAFLAGWYLPQLRHRPEVWPSMNPQSWVQIALLDAQGQKWGTTFGVVIGTGDEVVVPLSQVAGAQALELTFFDLSVQRLDRLYTDEERGLALIPCDPRSCPAIKIASPGSYRIGDQIFAAATPQSDAWQAGILADHDAVAPTPNFSPIMVMQLISLEERRLQGFLLNAQGELVGLTLSYEKTASFALPLGDLGEPRSRRGPIPVAQLPPAGHIELAYDAYLKGLLAADAHRLEDAGLHLQQAVALKPELLPARFLLGTYYYRQKKEYVREIDEYQKILVHQPNHQQVHYHLAQAYLFQGLQDQALQKLEQAYALDPNNTVIASELALAYIGAQEPEKAKTVINDLQRTHPGPASLLNNIISQCQRP